MCSAFAAICQRSNLLDASTGNDDLAAVDRVPSLVHIQHRQTTEANSGAGAIVSALLLLCSIQVAGFLLLKQILSNYNRSLGHPSPFLKEALHREGLAILALSRLPDSYSTFFAVSLRVSCLASCVVIANFIDFCFHSVLVFLCQAIRSSRRCWKTLSIAR